MEWQWTKGRDNRSQHEIYWQSNELHRNCFRGQEIIIIDLQCRRLVDYNLQLLCNYYGFITFEFAQPAQAKYRDLWTKSESRVVLFAVCE